MPALGLGRGLAKGPAEAEPRVVEQPPPRARKVAFNPDPHGTGGRGRFPPKRDKRDAATDGRARTDPPLIIGDNLEAKDTLVGPTPAEGPALRDDCARSAKGRGEVLTLGPGARTSASEVTAGRVLPPSETPETTPPPTPKL